MQVNDMHTDYYTVEVARLANPSIVRIVDLTTRFRLHHQSTGYRNPPPFDAIFAPSHFVANHDAVVAERMPTYVTHGAVDPAEYNPDTVTRADFCAKENWPAAAGGPTNGPVFGLIARISLEKGPGLFLAAAALVLQQIPDARFLMVGKPARKEYLEAIEKLAQAYGVADKVRSGIFAL